MPASAGADVWNAEQLIQIFNGESPPRLINPEAWPKFSQRFEQAFGFRPAPSSLPHVMACAVAPT
ncbi:MAG: hypothetical protein HYZ81_26625 [Nitrospinae bacterium]|nr:hypothetical protein [Nitrospinota bacterium]